MIKRAIGKAVVLKGRCMHIVPKHIRSVSACWLPSYIAERTIPNILAKLVRVEVQVRLLRLVNGPSEVSNGGLMQIRSQDTFLRVVRWPRLQRIEGPGLWVSLRCHCQRLLTPLHSTRISAQRHAGSPPKGLACRRPRHGD